MTQPRLPFAIERQRPKEKFDGASYEAARDGYRLTRQLDRVREVMQDGKWHTLAELAEKVQGSEAGVSARIRDLKKPRMGGHVIVKEYTENGLWRYRLVVNP